MTDQYAEAYKILKRAKNLERMGSDDRALDLYLELHNNYNPNTSDSFERPVVILERKKRYEEAIDFCNKAIELINDDKLSGTVEKFEKHLSRINEKLKEKPVKVKSEKFTDYKFGILGFRSKNKFKIATALLFYIIFVASGMLMNSIFITTSLFAITYTVLYFYGFIMIETDKKNKKIMLILFLSFILLTIFSFGQLPSAFTEFIELRAEENIDALEDGKEIFTEDENLPEISEESIEIAINDVKKNIEVKDIVIIINGSEIAFGILLDPTTSKSNAKDISEELVNTLSSIVSSNFDLKKPESIGYPHGELYDYYSIIISAGGNDTEIIAKGKKKKKSKYIIWN